MVLIIHDFSNKIVRFEDTNNKILWRGLASKLSDDVIIMILKNKKYNVIIKNIWNLKLWRLMELYHMFIEKIELKIDKIDFYNGVATDFKNKIKYILVLDMENIELDNNYNNILLLYTPYELSKTLENRLIKSDLTVHFIIL